MGAHWDGEGVNFAVFSDDAEKIELCLFDAQGRERRIELPGHTHNIFHGYLPGAGPGTAYGFRAYGPYRPTEGLRFNPNKLLLDPYAREWRGDHPLLDEDFAYVIGSPEQDLSFDQRDNAATAPKSVVVQEAFDWQDVPRPHTRWRDTLIYETHVKGMTRLHPLVPPELRGTYLGLCSAPVIAHLTRLGVTAVEILPVHSIMHDRRLRELGLKNYWGYGNLGYFRPDPRYAFSDARSEFKTMVRELHRAGLEVILDVVYNHTGEGSQLGPHLSFRGLCNRSYYRLDPNNPRFYRDYTGCGNTVNVDHPQVLQWVMDSLRYWVVEMGVDGFRYDLATALARHRSSFLDTIHQDPILKTVKLIAEPWDLGEGGYQAGNFPAGWSEWNDRYRDTVRRFWRGDPGCVSQLAQRLTGSADIFARARRGPTASINFVTCHDGFTLRDLVSYNDKHNEANGEDNRDGSNNNNSYNLGHEGPTQDRQILADRLRQSKNILATLFLSVGVPMLLGGDELARTQQGNNNAYCQDNQLSWFDWDSSRESQALIEFIEQIVGLRKRFQHFSRGSHLHDGEVRWLNSQGEQMQSHDWSDATSRTLGMEIPQENETLLLLFHAGPETLEFKLPEGRWQLEFSTVDDASPTKFNQRLKMIGRSLFCLRRSNPHSA